MSSRHVAILSLKFYKRVHLTLFLSSRSFQSEYQQIHAFYDWLDTLPHKTDSGPRSAERHNNDGVDDDEMAHAPHDGDL